MDVTTEVLVKGGLSLLAVVAVVWRHLRPGRLASEQAGRLLTLTAVLAALAWPNFGALHGRAGIHHWEQFHYFLGSKYFPELRYDGLYVATLAAEREIGLGWPVQSHVRDLRTNEVVPSAGVVEHARQVRARFEPDRWRAFVDDTHYFLTSNSYDYVSRIRKDHGYNPTPTWTFTARLFSRFVAASDGSLALLAWIDPLLLAAMFWMIGRTYGSRIACLSIIIWGLGYPWRFDWVGGAFLRQDWLAATGVAICLMRRGRDLPAGMLLAYAAMVRVFPGAFLVGPAVVALRQLTNRRPLAWLGRLAAGFAAGVALCLAAGSLTGVGTDAWPQFARNLDKHHGTWLTNNVGLANVLLYDGATMRREDVRWSLPEPWLLWQEKMNRLADERRPLLLAATALLLLLTGAAAWRWERDQAAVLGVAVTFAAALLTCYYWVMLLLIPIGRGRWLPAAGWLALNTGLYALHLATPAFEMIYGVLSWALLLFFVSWLAPDAFRAFSRGAESTTQ